MELCEEHRPFIWNSFSCSTLSVMRVLVVEDDLKLGRVLVRGLATDSITADLLTTGIEAITRPSAIEYAVIVLDVMLPDVAAPGPAVSESGRRGRDQRATA
jgi:CheY-like chemotaxis protein